MGIVTESGDKPVVRRVAVVGVHGIARHPAGETMTAMADLLLSLPTGLRGGGAETVRDCGPCGGLLSDSERKYTPFKAVGIHIPLQRVKVNPKGSTEVRHQRLLPKWWSWLRDAVSFEEQSAKFSAGLHQRGKFGAAEESGANQVATREAGLQTGNEYTGLLLDEYCGAADTNVYITTRLEGERKGSAGVGATKVDIYEVLWADLAHPESNFVGFFLSLFTLLIHLASLSRLAVDSGSKEVADWTGFRHLVWVLYLESQRWAVRILQIFLPLFKVLLLIVMLSAIPGISAMLGTNNANALACATALGLVGGVGVTFVLYSWNKRIRWPLTRNPWFWALTTLVPGGLGAWIGHSLAGWFSVQPQIVDSLLVWVCIGTPIFGFILSKYDGYRNGVKFWGWGAYLVSLGAFVFVLQWKPFDISVASFWLTEFGVAAIRVSWLALSFLAFSALFFGGLACVLQRDWEKRARLRAAVRTSRFALALPSVLFLLITPVLWAAMFRVADWVRPPFFVLNGKENQSRVLLDRLTDMHLIPNLSEPDILCGDYLKSALAWGMGYQVPVTIALALLALLLLVWWVVPSALLETFPLRNEKVPPRSSTNNQSRELGSWLSRGLDSTSVVTFLLWCSVFVAFPLVYILEFTCVQHWVEWVTLKTPLHLLGFNPGWLSKGLLVLKTFTTEKIVGSWLSLVSVAALATVAKYGSSVLTTILDVDTYLRSTPVTATPRAKIFERFASTMRYVAAYEDEQHCKYDSVVIVAHSLGSLIAADLLRYLYVGQSGVRSDPGLARYEFGGEKSAEPLTLQLLTMGSPIRQLLNRFFPYLYDWVRPVPDHSMAPLQAPAVPKDAPAMIMGLPDPKMLGLERWVNVYRSGDYVGRSLWLNEWYNRTRFAGEDAGRYPDKIHMAKSSTADREEMCIGAGAHTHYWDDTAPDVAEMLDSMI